MSATSYFTDAGPIRWEHHIDALGVLESRDNHVPIGVALAFGIDEDRPSLWRLTVRGAAVPGVFIVVDRAFRPAPCRHILLQTGRDDLGFQ
jgi:hypothetical protein